MIVKVVKRVQPPRLQRDDLVFALIVGFVNVACISIFLLPQSLRNMLKASLTTFNPVTYVTANFVHDSSQHLAFNLIAFSPAAFLAYSINRRLNEQRFFFSSLLILFTALPILYYGLSFSLGFHKPPIEFGCGLSLVGSGLVGFMVPSLMLYFKHKLEEFNSGGFFLFMLVLTLFTISLIYFFYTSLIPALEAIKLALLALAIVLGITSFIYGLLVVKEMLSLQAKMPKSKRNVCENLLISSTLLTYFLLIFSLFPLITTLQVMRIDIISHSIGLIFGITIFSLLVFTKKMKTKDNKLQAPSQELYNN